MSTSYQGFAYVYDRFMDNIPYEEWHDYIKELFHEYNISEGTLVELGCGTGTLANYFANDGYSIIGVDNSADMLTIASEKITPENDILLLLQNMQELELLEDSIYDGFYCVCDSLNYLLEASDVCKTFQKVKQYLKPNGIFLFDLKTRYFYEEVLGDQVFCDHQEDCSYTWENCYFEEDQINQYDLTIFVKEPDAELFERFTETHHQKAYDLTEMIDLLNVSGLEYVTAYDAFTKNAPTATSERVYIIARNGDKTNE